MSYFDMKQLLYTEALTIVDQVTSQGGSIEEIRNELRKKIQEVDDIKSKI